MGNGDMDWKKWAIKGLKRVGMAVAVTAGDASINYLAETQHEIPAEYVFVTAIAIAGLQQLVNYLKHK